MTRRGSGDSFSVKCPSCDVLCAYVGAIPSAVECVNPFCRFYSRRRDDEVYGPGHGCARCGKKKCPGTCPIPMEEGA